MFSPTFVSRSKNKTSANPRCTKWRCLSSLVQGRQFVRCGLVFFCLTMAKRHFWSATTHQKHSKAIGFCYPDLSTHSFRRACSLNMPWAGLHITSRCNSQLPISWFLVDLCSLWFWNWYGIAWINVTLLLTSNVVPTIFPTWNIFVIRLIWNYFDLFCQLFCQSED